MAANGFRRIERQVHENLLYLAAIGLNGRQIRFRQIEVQGDFLGNGRAHQARSFRGREPREQRLHHETCPLPE